MAQFIVSAAGAAVGFAIGGPTGAQIGWAIGGAIGSTFGPTQKAQGPRLGDLRVTGTEYGQTIPWVAGSPRIAGQIVWASPRRETATTESAGGKGGGGGSEYTSYSYDCDLLILLTENETAGVSRIWSNNDLVYDGTARAGVWSDLRIYTGTDDQLPDPTYEAAVGVGNAPAYRGRTYVFIQGLQLGQSGAIPNLTFEIAYSRNDTVAPDYVFRATYDIDGSDEIDPVASFSVNGDTPVSFGPARFVNTTGALYQAKLVYEFGAGPAEGKISPAEYPAQDFCIAIDIVSMFARVIAGTVDGVITSQTSIVNLQPAFGFQGLFLRVDVPQTQIPAIKLYKGSIASLVFVTELWRSTAGVAIKFFFPADGSPVEVYVNGVLATTVDLGTNRTSLISAAVGMSAAFGATGPRLETIQFSNFRAYVGGVDAESEITLTEEPLPFAVQNLMYRAGYLPGDFDVSELDMTKIVRGFALGNIANTRSALEVLQSAFFFEAAKSDKIYFRPRAVSPVATIFYDDLNTKPESGPDGEPFALTVANDLEIPSQIGLTFNNMLGDYQNATEYSERVFVTQDAINSVQLPIGLFPSEGKGIADAMLIDQIASKASAPLSLPLDYAALEPSDVVEVQTPDRVYRMRLISRTDAAGILSYEAVVDDANALTSAAITDSDYPTQDALLQVAETIWLALDVPIFNDGANAPGYYVVAKKDDGDLWPGAVFLRSFDDVSFSQVQQFPNQSTFGDCDTTLGAWVGGYVWDETNTLDVTVNGELSSSTKDAMLNDATINVALVGEDGAWECIRFRNAELLDVGQYRLSGFLRGFRGTEWAMDSHGAGEQFVYVTEAIRRVGTDVSQIGLLRYIKAVTAGFRADSVTSVEFTDTGVALKPFAPVNPVALADGSDVVVTWQRRTRLTTRYGGAAPGQVVPLGEASESYEVQIFNGSTLVRSEVVTSPTYTYLAADWATDGFVSTDVATFIIAQLSETVGAGYEATAEGIIP